MQQSIYPMKFRLHEPANSWLSTTFVLTNKIDSIVDSC